MDFSLSPFDGCVRVTDHGLDRARVAVRGAAASPAVAAQPTARWRRAKFLAEHGGSRLFEASILIADPARDELGYTLDLPDRAGAATGVAQTMHMVSPGSHVMIAMTPCRKHAEAWLEWARERFRFRRHVHYGEATEHPLEDRGEGAA